MGKRLVGAAAALGLAVGMVVTAVLAGTGVAGDDGPEPLPILAAVDGTATREAAGASSMMAGGVEYRFDGELPELDGEASAWRVESPEDVEGRIAALAEQVGVEGEVVAEDGVWRVVDGSRQLEVYDQPGLPWNVYDTAGDGSGGVAIGCVPEVCEEQLRAQRPADLPTREEAEAQARALLGPALDGAAVRVDDGLTSWYVSFDPVVGGLPTVGMAWGVAIGGGGEVQSASGWLGTATEGDRYPLLGAGEALRRLQEQQVTTLVAPACDPGPAVDCGPIEPTVVALTDVRLGLQLYGEHLVPSYLFSVDGGGGELPVVAVTDEFLVGPETSADPDTPVRSEPPGVTEPGPAAPPRGGATESCTSGTAFGNDLTAEVCQPAPAVVGEPVTLVLRASSATAPVRQDCASPAVANWADGTRSGAVCEIACVPDDAPTEGSAIEASFEHTYLTPGAYDVEVSLESNCGEPPGTRMVLVHQVVVDG